MACEDLGLLRIALHVPDLVTMYVLDKGGGFWIAAALTTAFDLQGQYCGGRDPVSQSKP